MVKSCSIKGCKTEWIASKNNVFHRLPTNTEIKKKWLDSIPQNLLPKITNSTLICGKHFETSCYEVGSMCRRRLKKDAVPTIYQSTENTENNINSCNTEHTNAQHTLQVNTSFNNACATNNLDFPDSPIINDSTNQMTPDIPDVSTSMEVQVSVQSPTQTAIDSEKDMERNEIGDPKRIKKDVAIQVERERLPQSPKVKRLQRQIKVLQQRLKRRDKTMASMRSLINHLKENGKCTTALEDALETNFSGLTLNLIKNEFQNQNIAPTRVRYSDEIKQFALTLSFYSPKAYSFVRKEFHLPHPASLRKWMGAYNCEVGFLSEVFQYLQQDVTEKPYLREVALIFDSMSIRSQLVHDVKNDKIRGYIDYGNIAVESKEELATEALVFQIVSYTSRFKCPIAYFFVNKLNAELQTELLKHAIILLQEIGITVRSLTCDGCITNKKTLELLGCRFSTLPFKTMFTHPSHDVNIHCILDPCHMIKLCRNALAECNITSPQGDIKFDFIKKLHILQEKEQFKAANRLSNAHISFHNKKMNVKLAVQTISSGVADAINFLRHSGNKDFENSEATCEFVRICDRLFDMMNARNSFGKNFKAPMTKNNLKLFKDYFDFSTKYLSTLKIKNIPILHSNRKTFALGFILNASSFLNLANDLFSMPQHSLKYFLPYKCSQDNLELYFSCIRNQGGWNDNPNCLQFKWALRKLLFQNKVSASINANCINDTSNVPAIFKFHNPHSEINENEDIEDTPQLNNLVDMLNKMEHSTFVKNILHYISGHIVSKLSVKIACVHCINIITAADKDDHSYCIKTNSNAFTSFINRGGLTFPSAAVEQIVTMTEKIFKSHIIIEGLTSKNFKSNIVRNLIQIFQTKLFSIFTPPHPITDTTADSHELYLLSSIAQHYLTIRIHDYTKRTNSKLLGSRETMRQKLHKTILFYHV